MIQVQGFRPGQVILMVNFDVLSSVSSQEDFDKVLQRNLDKYKVIHITVKAEDKM